MSQQVMSREEDVLKYVDEKALIDLAQSLVRIQSPTGQEEKIARFVGKTMEKIGLIVEYVEGEKGRPNVIGRINGSIGKPTLLMVAHMDAIGIGNRNDWFVDPFGAEIRDGKLYGRGASDDKGSLASMIMAAKTIVDAGIKLRGNVVLLGTVGEEVRDPLGMKYVVDKGYVKPDMAIYCHSSDGKIKAYWKSRVVYTINVFGKSGHTDFPKKGINAISKMARIIQAIEERGFTYERHPVLGDCTYVFTLINGGMHQNVIPDLCTANLNVRLVPGQSHQGVKQEIESLIQELKEKDPDLRAEVEYGILPENPIELRPDEPIIRIVKDATTYVYGEALGIGGASGLGELYHVLTRGIPGVVYGPGYRDTGNVCGANEFVETDLLVKAAKVYALSILKICG